MEYPTTTNTVVQNKATTYLTGALRIALGGIFFWAFLDKLFGLGFATARENAWLQGGSPTNGFLSFGTKGPFADAFQAIAGHPVVDALFMFGLFAVGVALLSGIAVRIAGYAGAAMMLMMWLAVLPPAQNPVLDDHIVYAIALLYLAHAHSGRYIGLGKYWSRIPTVSRHPMLE